jgi:hypothetical protein
MGLSFELQSFMQSSWGISFQHFWCTKPSN